MQFSLPSLRLQRLDRQQQEEVRRREVVDDVLEVEDPLHEAVLVVHHHRSTCSVTSLTGGSPVLASTWMKHITATIAAAATAAISCCRVSALANRPIARVAAPIRNSPM